MSGRLAAITETKDGVRIKVRLTPRASRDEIAGFRDGDGDALLIRVTAPPTENKANQGLCKLVAKQLGVAKGRVAVVGGAKSRDKILEVQGISVAEASAALEG